MNDYEELFKQITEVLKSEEVPALQAKFARELFEAYKEEGFSESQALELVKSAEPIEVNAEL